MSISRVDNLVDFHTHTPPFFFSCWFFSVRRRILYTMKSVVKEYISQYILRMILLDNPHLSLMCASNPGIGPHSAGWVVKSSFLEILLGRLRWVPPLPGFKWGGKRVPRKLETQCRDSSFYSDKQMAFPTIILCRSKGGLDFLPSKLLCFLSVRARGCL